MSRSKNHRRKANLPRPPARHIVVRAIRREQVDIPKLARALMTLAEQEAAAERRQAEQETTDR